MKAKKIIKIFFVTSHLKTLFSAGAQSNFKIVKVMIQGFSPALNASIGVAVTPYCRYRDAYVDYMAALRIDSSIKMAWDASTRYFSVLEFSKLQR